MGIIKNKNNRTVLIEKCFNIFCEDGTGFVRNEDEFIARYLIIIDEAIFEITYDSETDYFTEYGDYNFDTFSDLYVSEIKFQEFDENYTAQAGMIADGYDFRTKSPMMEERYNEILHQIFNNLKCNNRILKWR